MADRRAQTHEPNTASVRDAGARPYKSKNGSIDFVEEIPTRPHRHAKASTVLAA